MKNTRIYEMVVRLKENLEYASNNYFQGDATTVLLEIVSKDPVSPETEKIKSKLLLIGAIGTLITGYGVTFKTIPGLTMEFPNGQNGLLQGMIGLYLFYLLFRYFWYFAIDLDRWFNCGRLLRAKAWCHAINCLASITADRIDEVDHAALTQEQQESMTQLQQRFDIFYNNALVMMETVTGHYKRLESLVIFRIFFFDILLPFALGVLPLIKLFPEMLGFICVLF